MEQIIKPITRWEIKLSEHETLILDSWELTTLVLWLIAAKATINMKPLWLNGMRYAKQNGGEVVVCDHFTKLSKARIIDIINAIYGLTDIEHTSIYLLSTNYPKADSWQSGFDQVDLKETSSGSFIGYWREDTGESILPVKLRWFEDMGVWYGVKGKPNGGVSFDFKDLSICQI